MSEIYDDGTIVCGPDRLEIHMYYFPFGTKSVSYTRIKGLRRFEINGLMSGRYRIWGTGNPRHWANLDAGRPRKHAGFVVDIGAAISPIVTPDRPDKFESVLRAQANLGPDDGSQIRGPFI